MSTTVEPIIGVQANQVDLERKIRTEVRDEERKIFENRFEAWKAKELAALEEQQNKTISEELSKLQKKIQDEQQPLTKEAIQQLVDQEYAEIPIKINVVADDGDIKTETFILRELPKSVERKFYRQFKNRVKDKGSELSAFSQKVQEEPFETQLLSFLDTFDGAFDVLTDAVLLCINPFGKKPEITAEWVDNNISSNRAYSIILAQVEVNRLRDFFSRVFASGQKAGTILMPPNLQSLRHLAR